MITCRKCGKENQDHYKFCLGCGAELPREAAAPKPFSPQTPPHGVPAAVVAPAAPMAAPAPAPLASTAPVFQPPRPAPVAAPAPVEVPVAAAAADVSCPQCSHVNPQGNRFCAGCGYNLSALAAAPAPAPVAAPVAPAATAAGGFPVQFVALRADGTEAGSYLLPDTATVVIGRDTGSIFAGDSYLSPKHALITRRGVELLVKDTNSLNGVYLKLRPHAPWPLEFGDIFRIGQEIVRFEELVSQPPTADGVHRFGSPAKGYVGRLALVIGRDTTGNSFPIPERGVHCGRERGDILFAEDGYVSGLHCRLGRDPDGRITLTDVGSSNGTFVRIKTEHGLITGDVLLMGQQLFRVDY